MPSPLPLFPTTVIGSMPRPQYVKDLLAAAPRDGNVDPARQRRMDDAVRLVSGLQELLGSTSSPTGNGGARVTWISAAK